MLNFFLVILLFLRHVSTSDTKVSQNEHRPSESYFMSIWHNRLYLYSAAALVFGIWFSLKMALKKKSFSKDIGPWVYKAVKNNDSSDRDTAVHVSGVKIFYGSQTGTAKAFAKELSEEVKNLGIPAEVTDMKDYDPDDQLADECTSKSVCVFLVATYTDGQPTENAEWFCKWLEEASTDFRYGKTYLKGLRYAVFGLGNSVYVGHYNTVGKNVDKWLWMLSGMRVMTRGEGDCNVVKSRNGSIQADFQAWKVKFLNRLQALAKGEKKSCSGNCKTGGSCKNKRKDGHMEEEEEEEKAAPQNPSPEDALIESSSDEDESGLQDEKKSGSVVDMEDLGNIMNSAKKAKSKEEGRGDGQTVKLSKLNGVKKIGDEEERREMITPALREALTKQGYKLIGSHSGVKLCRWTKSMLRGRGGCYKHTFYGIESHRCMETTPSLACANKCVFCWRHHTNPVGTEWRWKMDPAEKILQDAVEKHQNMIRQFRGVPGVKPERYEEGLAVKHCALSLVGEPIMYPEINTFIRLLHSQQISSFLVTNAQFPQEIRSLVPVTQLYVSVDASTKDSLKKIDRPLFKDFWPRFLDSLKALGEKRQRTVYRLTLVKAWNVEEMQAYSELIALGQPDFIEVKGVTYCGESSASSLTMANVPWHQEVVAFVQQLADMLPQYEIACEHEHSNCLLIAHTKFKVDGEWWTWIDYERFQELVQAHEESGGQRSFSALDYMARTPSWALFGACEQGFDPADTRFQRRNKTKDISGC
ncbi:S-adenosyl-L-methionine-dependent tRNA 4-demethylwyosine synthase [Seriola lalandi dorsalis]|uniref:S-adenosyl-L-methionine-dependent tRNA 4-demethylwyosine synthase TYW1 n=1 Tax=Seriola lalandi dorsalis TaxID=1841481 RepID=A0A3B4WU59_SERLL|nr:S-adenosyl-L-methionine-dependent tRNA 4-demethylwyosine synthase [Seriola lalandi dorsalis]XP_056230486.1 S-adenosyl-L-methionine-dependent tRNA 4-demethylwyosine synthase TYW1 [Seriola aureovittata]XP_056230487.1 S-adenosyl-L-methionine-dependent tRNA 4-demethylwyosine synthase TYW1 [Seriola aureovittata]